MKKRFPQYLASPFQVLWLESDELVIGLVCFVLAVCLGNVTWLLTIAGPYAYIKAKKRYPRGFLRHVLYFIGVVQMNGYPTYFEKEFVE
jgi:type IV conjugative transfer system protein TraL